MSNETGRMVYVVTVGAYSDYEIRAIFSTREQADDYARWQNGPDDPDATRYESDTLRVEEYPLDAEAPRSTGAFVAHIWFGKSGAGWARQGAGPPSWKADAVVRSPTTRITNPGVLTVTGYGKTGEHARRSADELARAIVAGTYVVAT